MLTVGGGDQSQAVFGVIKVALPAPRRPSLRHEVALPPKLFLIERIEQLEDAEIRARHHVAKSSGGVHLLMLSASPTQEPKCVTPVPFPAMKVVSLLPSATEIVFALWPWYFLVGVTDECDFPPEAVTKPVVSRSALSQGRPLSAREIDEAVRGKLDAKEPLDVLDTDLLRRERPTSSSRRTCAGSAPSPRGQVQQALDKLGLPDAKVLSLDPHTLDEVIAQIDVVGKLLERAEEAATLTESLRMRVAKVKEVATRLPVAERVLPRVGRSAVRGGSLGARDGGGGRRREPPLARRAARPRS